MKNTLIILAHPDLKNSIANKTIIKKIKDYGFKNVKISDLTALYDNFAIDVEKEQKKIIDAHMIIFQYPFYWYNVPPILKQWIDKVFTYGFAYGHNESKLKGKKLLLSITTGGPEEAYRRSGINHFTIDELSAPLKQTARFVNMDFLQPVVSYGLVNAQNSGKSQETADKLEKHAEKIIELIKKHTL